MSLNRLFGAPRLLIVFHRWNTLFLCFYLGILVIGGHITLVITSKWSDLKNYKMTVGAKGYRRREGTQLRPRPTAAEKRPRFSKNSACFVFESNRNIRT